MTAKHTRCPCILKAPPSWSLYRVHYSEGEPVAVIAPSFGAALDAMVAYLNRDSETEGFEPVTRADLERWCDQVVWLPHEIVIAEGWVVAAPAPSDEALGAREVRWEVTG